MEVKDAMQQAAIKLRDNVTGDNQVLAPNSSTPITVDPVFSAYFDLNYPDAGTMEKVDAIKGYLANVTNENSFISELRRIESKLGNPKGTRIDNVYNYIRLKMQSDTLNRAADAMLK